MFDSLRLTLSSLCFLAGLFVMASALFGVFRFRYALNRIHAAALLDTLGMLFMMLGVILALGLDMAALKAGVLVLFLWVTSPVASHLIGRLQTTVEKHPEAHMDLVNLSAEADSGEEARP